MAGPRPRKIPSFRLRSMERIVAETNPLQKTIKAVALHTGLKVEEVKAHLDVLRSKGEILKTSHFYQK